MMDLQHFSFNDNDPNYPLLLNNSNGTSYPIIAYDFSTLTGLLIERHSTQPNLYIIAKNLNLANPSDKGYSWGQGDYYNNKEIAVLEFIKEIGKEGLDEDIEELICPKFSNLNLSTFIRCVSTGYGLVAGKLYQLNNIFQSINGSYDKIYEFKLMDNEYKPTVWVKDTDVEEMCNNRCIIYSNEDDFPF